MTDNTSGYRCEDRVAEYLKDRGHRILARNYSTRYGEIDIIYVDCENGDLVFGEVKYRQDASCGEPYEYVNAAKIKRIEYTANHFLEFETDGEYQSVRIDVFSVKGGFEMEHYKNITF